MDENSTDNLEYIKENYKKNNAGDILRIEMLSKRQKIKCPRCEVVALLVPVAEWEKQSLVLATIYMCPNCSKPVFLDWQASYLGVPPVYPLGKPPDIHQAIPPSVASDYKEALQCFTINAPRATVAMCRRALQTSVIEQGAKKDANLVDQIDDLNQQGKITKDLRDWAHQIRLTGNLGAHPDTDGLKDVTPQDAEEVLNFLDSYFNYVYILPAQVKKHKERKFDKNQST